MRFAPQALGREPLRLLERGRSGPTSIPSISAGMSLREPGLADQREHRRVGARPALVAGDAGSRPGLRAAQASSAST